MSSSAYQLSLFGEKLPTSINYLVKSFKNISTKNKMHQKAAMMSSKDQTWETPIWFYEQLCKERGIKEYDTDPATNERNHLGCRIFYTEKEDGLKQRWEGNVFINPPFGFGYYQNKWTYFTGLWIEEAWRKVNCSKDPVERVTMIIPARCDTKAFHKYCWDYNKAQSRPGCTINFNPGRISFGDGSNGPAPFVTMIIDFVRMTIK